MRGNLESIRHDGLLPARSRGKEQAVWLHTAGLMPWAILHVQGRHGGALGDLVVIEVTVPWSWLVRVRRGLWKCQWVISPEWIAGVMEATAFAVSLVGNRGE